MKYYGTHDFRENLIAKTCKFKKVNVSDYIILPNINMYEIGSVFIEGDEISIIDNFRNVNEILNKDKIIDFISTTDQLKYLFFNVDNRINLNNKIYIYGIDSTGYNININNISLLLKITKLDMSGSNDINNIHIIDATLSSDFTHNNTQAMNEFLNKIFNENIQISIYIDYDNTNLLYNILNNNIYISQKFNNVYNISGSMYANQYIKDVINIDTTDIGNINSQNPFLYFDTTFNNLTLRINYSNIIDTVNIDNKIIDNIFIPKHKHDVLDISTNINDRNGLVFINNMNEIDFSNDVNVKNLNVIYKNSILN